MSVGGNVIEKEFQSFCTNLLESNKTKQRREKRSYFE